MSTKRAFLFALPGESSGAVCQDAAPSPHPAPRTKRVKEEEPDFVASPHTAPQHVCEAKDALLFSTYQVVVSQLPANYTQEPWFTALTLQPVVSSVCPAKPKPLQLYTQVKGILYLPRFAGLLSLGLPPPGRDFRVLGERMQDTAHFTGALCATNPPQIPAVQATLQQLQALGGALLVLPCGFGKTVCSLSIAATLHRRTLILVHAEALGAQWVDRIHAFVPGAKVGKIQQDVVDVDGCDFVVAMIQSLVKRDYALAVVQSFGLVIVDEAHHVAAPMFSKALPKLPARYVLGLSATPNRTDGCGVALEYLLGPTVFKARRVHEHVTVRILTYTRGAEEELVNRQGKPLCSTMLSNIATDLTRTQWVCDLIQEQAAAQRNTLVLSDRLDQLSMLEQLLRQQAPGVSVGRVVGGTRAKNREQGFAASVILSTYTYASEGIDIPRLDTLVMATPRGNVEQTIGRILRPFPAKPVPLVLDIKDPFSLFTAMAWKRHRYYKSQGYRTYFALDVPDSNDQGDAKSGEEEASSQ
jgi:superfamily II DNA or RNA helicase